MFSDRTIVENASASADHTTLVAAVKQAGLVETLAGEGPFTVFAPTDAAFAARLKAWLTGPRVRGGAFAMLRQVRAYCGGCEVRTVDNSSNWHVIDADGVESYEIGAAPAWNWDGDTASWARFW